MQNLSTAFLFLTLGRDRRSHQLAPARAGAAALYFPLVGLVQGITLNIVNRGLEPYLASEILSVVVVAVLVLLSTASHLEGLQKTFDLFERESIKRTVPGIGNMGLVATLFVLLLKIRSVEITGELLGVGLLLTPIFARWGLVLFIYGAPAVLDERVSAMADQVKTWHMFVTSAATLGLAYFLAGRLALWIGLCLSLLALGGRQFLGRRHGGVTYDNFGALIEVGEMLSFLFFASV